MKRSIREAYGEALVKLGSEEPRLVVLDADVSNSTRTIHFAEKFPERFFNLGIAEANMMGISAGLALLGKIPIVNTFSFLTTLRCGDQVRTSIAYPKLNVKIAGAYGGLSDSYDGPTHHSICDIAIMRSIPNMNVMVVGAPDEVEEILRIAVKTDGPVFIRLSRGEAYPIKELIPEALSVEFGKGRILKEGEDLTIIVTGILIGRVLEATKILERDGISARVIEIHTIKPIDKDLIVESALKTGAIVTVEEHNVIGGLGSAVAEVLSKEYPIPVEMIGIKDTFAESGEYEALLDKYGLGIYNISEKARIALKRKRGE
jgi:transketolase